MLIWYEIHFMLVSIQNLIKHLSFEAKVVAIFRLFDQSDDDVIFEDESDDQLKS